MTTEAELAYLAGFIDGEGSVSVSRQSGRNVYQIHVQVTQIDPAPLLMLREHFGGQIRVRRETRGFRDCHLWKVQSQYAARALRMLLPYLLVKHEEAELCVALQERIMARSRGTQEAFEEEVLERERLYQRVKALKKRTFEPVTTTGSIVETRLPRLRPYRLSGGQGSGKPRPNRQKPVNVERLSRVRTMRRDHKSWRTIAKELDVSLACPKAYIRRWGMGE